MRLGVDVGGTKIEILAIGGGSTEILRQRVPMPGDSYDAAVRAIVECVRTTEQKLGCAGSVGVAIPGVISPVSGLIKNANSTILNGYPLDQDLTAALGRPVRIENDANCFTLSEATDGAAAGANVVFGIVAGTGIGGGVCVEGKVLKGAHSMAGEWGHNPLPWPNQREVEHAPPCHCGKRGCIEAWCSGPAVSERHYRRTRKRLTAREIVEQARQGHEAAQLTLENLVDRLARAIATVVNILDPDVIVMGGGLSNIDELYEELPDFVRRHAVASEHPTKIVKAFHGDASGVRGAAWLWSEEEVEAALPR